MLKNEYGSEKSSTHKAPSIWKPCTGDYQIDMCVREQFVRRKSKGSAESVWEEAVWELMEQCGVKRVEIRCAVWWGASEVILAKVLHAHYGFYETSTELGCSAPKWYLKKRNCSNQSDIKLENRPWRWKPVYKFLPSVLMIAYIALFSALLSRLTALACGSTWVTSFL